MEVRKALQRLAALEEKVERERQREGLDDVRAWHRRSETRLRRDADERPEQVCWEAALASERQEVRELLSANCAELTAHLNTLREELLEQRHAFDLQSQQAAGWCQSGSASLSAAGLEAQVAELGGVLTARLQAKIAAVSDALNEKIAVVQVDIERSLRDGQERVPRRDHSEVERDSARLGGDADILEEFRREVDQALEAAGDEVRTVHLEVMSVDTRVAALEERLRYAPRSRSLSPGSACRTVNFSAAASNESSARATDAPRMRSSWVTGIAT
jgi:hypothetical protein